MIASLDLDRYQLELFVRPDLGAVVLEKQPKPFLCYQQGKEQFWEARLNVGQGFRKLNVRLHLMAASDSRAPSLMENYLNSNASQRSYLARGIPLRKNPVTPVFYCRKQQKAFEPICPHCGASLSAQNDSTQDYLFCLNCENDPGTKNSRYSTAFQQALEYKSIADLIRSWSDTLTDKLTVKSSFPCQSCVHAKNCYPPDTNTGQQRAEHLIEPLFSYNGYLFIEDSQVLSLQDWLNVLAGEKHWAQYLEHINSTADKQRTQRWRLMSALDGGNASLVAAFSRLGLQKNLEHRLQLITSLLEAFLQHHQAEQWVPLNLHPDALYPRFDYERDAEKLFQQTDYELLIYPLAQQAISQSPSSSTLPAQVSGKLYIESVNVEDGLLGVTARFLCTDLDQLDFQQLQISFAQQEGFATPLDVNFEPLSCGDSGWLLHASVQNSAAAPQFNIMRQVPGLQVEARPGHKIDVTALQVLAEQQQQLAATLLFCLLGERFSTYPAFISVFDQWMAAAQGQSLKQWLEQQFDEDVLSGLYVQAKASETELLRPYWEQILFLLDVGMKQLLADEQTDLHVLADILQGLGEVKYRLASGAAIGLTQEQEQAQVQLILQELLDDQAWMEDFSAALQAPVPSRLPAFTYGLPSNPPIAPSQQEVETIQLEKMQGPAVMEDDELDATIILGKEEMASLSAGRSESSDRHFTANLDDELDATIIIPSAHKPRGAR